MRPTTPIGIGLLTMATLSLVGHMLGQQPGETGGQLIRRLSQVQLAPVEVVGVDTSQPVFWANWSPRTPTPENPRGYANEWLNHPDQYARAEFHRRDANGELVRRYVARLEHPSPQDNGTAAGQSAVPFSVWHGISTDRRAVIIRNVEERRLEDRLAGRPEMSFGLYVAAWSNGSPYTVDMRTATAVVDVTSKAGRQRWLATMGPWISTGVLSEVWYDAGSTAENLAAILALIDWQRSKYGLHGATEALIHSLETRPGAPRWPANIRWPAAFLAPQMAISRFVLDRDPLGRLRWAPDEEVHIINSPNLRVDGTSGALGAVQALDFAARGWKVGSNRRYLDQFVNLCP